ncbi:hypothetical protein [Glutamicibacter nicotianae]|uniref:hypothetical protein n=1 Tax=Glutamicibacter nicotianae TaxID=37929 RepID=UPI00167FAAF2|nr:hypothetical protein [Glutamicibacter nicotianae]
MPPIPEWLGGANGLLGGTAVVILLIAFFWKPGKVVWKIFKTLVAFAEDWNGTEDRLDKSGAVIEKGRPGVPALLETVRSQVQNSHGTNMRDDLDKAIATGEQNVTALTHLAKTLTQHIAEADKSVAKQDENIARIADDVGKLKSKYAPES